MPVAVIALGIIGFFFWRHRRNKKRSQTFELQNNGPDNAYAARGVGGGATGGYHDNHTPPPVQEAEGSPMPAQKKGYFGGRVELGWVWGSVCVINVSPSHDIVFRLEKTV